MESAPHWLMVVIAAILNIIIGSIWYSDWLFGKTWKAHHKMSSHDACCTGGKMIFSLITSLILAYFLYWFEQQMGVTTVQDGLFVGFCAWLGFVVTTQSAGVIWCRQPFPLFLIATGNRLVSFLVLGGFLGA